MSKVKYILLAALIMFALIITVANAEGEGASTSPEIEATVQVQVDIAGIPPKVPEDYNIILTADKDEFPMPEGGKGGSYTLTITGPGSDVFPEFKFNRVGIYTYTVEQEKGDHPTAISYDETIYKLKITIYRDEEDNFYIAVAIRTEEEEDKTDICVFLNKYKPTEEIEPPTPLGFGVFINVGDCLE